MAGRREQPARRARRRQSTLGADLRPGHRRDQRGLRDPGCAAVASRAARLARHRAGREGMEPEGDRPLDRRVCDLPAVLDRRAVAARAGSRPTGCWRAARGSASTPRPSATSSSRFSGLLSPKMHGPSVFPAQPPGIWNMPYNTDTWTTSEGEDRYRRSLYTFWRRTSPYPSFMTFDASSREYCTARRVRTNTPLQALTLLNDPASFEAARALAARMMTEPAAGEHRALARGLRHHAGAVARPGSRARSIAWSRSTKASARTTSRARTKRPKSPARPRMVRPFPSGQHGPSSPTCSSISTRP